MKSISCGVLVLILCGAGSSSWAVRQDAQDVAKMELLLKEAGDLQSTQPQAVAEKLAPVLDELRRQRQNGNLTPDGARILQEALLIHLRTQIMLLVPEQEITPIFREILVTNLAIDESVFNPREKQLLQKIRSADTGRLILQTTPPGVTLIYAGVEIGKTPASIPLVAGTYRFKLTLSGYLDQDLEVTIRPLEDTTETRVLRRRTVDIPLSVNAPGATVLVNGRSAGATQSYNEWLAALPAHRRQDFAEIVQQWNVDRAASGFARLTDVPVGEPVRIELQAVCYESVVLQFTVADQEVDWARPIVVRPELRRIELKRDTGYMEVSSNPAGAEVWVDGTFQGTTPVGKDVCAGSHRVQVLHRAGQYVQEVTIRRGQASRVAGELRPALVFLGIYDRNSGGQITPANTEWETVARRISLRTTAFSDPRIAPEEIEALRRKGTLPLEQLLQEGLSASAEDALLKRISAAAGRADLMLVGVRAEGKFVFRLYSTLHPVPDTIDVPGLGDTGLDFLIGGINRAETSIARLKAPDPGIELVDSPRGLVVLSVNPTIAAGKTALAPGTLVRSVDQKAMNFREYQAMLQTKKPGQTVTLGIQTKDTTGTVPIVVPFSGTEYPWSTPDGFSNAVLAILKWTLERDPLSEDAKYAGLSLARAFMNHKEWKLALEFLARTNLEPNKSGVCPGTVLYYQGRCYEELGDRAQAESYYARAKDYGEATLGMPGGPAVAPLADQRIQFLRKK